MSETEKIFCNRWFSDLNATVRNHNRSTVHSQAGIGIILAKILKNGKERKYDSLLLQCGYSSAFTLSGWNEVTSG
jgi:hypothetical protein